MDERCRRRGTAVECRGALPEERCAACGGMLRWAENGRVPGARICTICGREWVLRRVEGGRWIMRPY